jgi:hypothetical protein
MPELMGALVDVNAYGQRKNCDGEANATDMPSGLQELPNAGIRATREAGSA